MSAVVALKLSRPGSVSTTPLQSIGIGQDFNQRDADQAIGSGRLASTLTDQIGSRVLAAEPIEHIGCLHEIPGSCGKIPGFKRFETVSHQIPESAGVAGELRGITQNPQYAKKIVPALEMCHEVTCVGHSLGGALCNVFAMCANSDPGNSNRRADRNGNDDFEALTWKAR